MVNKISNKLLITVFVVLAAIVLLMYFSSGKSERSFKSNLVEADTAKVDKILLYPKATKHKEVTLIKNGKKWFVKLENKDAEIPANIIGGILTQLQKMKPSKLAARREEKWAEFQVDTAGTRVKVFEEGDEQADFVVGKFKFVQPRSVYSYVRMTDDKDVYEVEGFLDMTFNKTPNNLRDTKIINSENSKWQAVSFNFYNDSSFTLLKVNDKWECSEFTIDSAKTATELRKLARVNGTTFFDDIKPEDLGKPVFTLSINADKENEILVNAYNVNGKNVISSSMNPGSYFDGNVSGLKSKLIVKQKEFIK